MTNSPFARNNDANVIVDIHSVDHEICSISLDSSSRGSLQRNNVTTVITCQV